MTLANMTIANEAFYTTRDSRSRSFGGGVWYAPTRVINITVLVQTAQQEAAILALWSGAAVAVVFPDGMSFARATAIAQTLPIQKHPYTLTLDISEVLP